MCFAVYSANLAYSRVYKPVLEELGLTYPQYVTIVALWDEEELTVKGLSDKLFLEPSTVTRRRSCRGPTPASGPRTL